MLCATVSGAHTTCSWHEPTLLAAEVAHRIPCKIGSRGAGGFRCLRGVGDEVLGEGDVLGEGEGMSDGEGVRAGERGGELLIGDCGGGRMGGLLLPG